VRSKADEMATKCRKLGGCGSQGHWK